MHFSHAFVVALSVVATTQTTSALPVHGVAGPSSGLAARAADVTALNRVVNTLAARGGMHADVAEASRGVFARYADVADEHERSLFIARDLSKRGILDMLVAALRDLLVELLGKGGTARKRDQDKTTQSLQMLTGLDFSTKTAARQSWSQMLAALSQALEQESKALASKDAPQGAANTTTKAANTTSKAANATSTGVSAGSASAGKNATSSSVSAGGASVSASATALPIDTGLPAVGGNNAIEDRKAANARQGNKAVKRETMELIARQEEGLTGLLQVLRNLVDAILNTLLPMSSRSASTSSNSTSSSWGEDCPSPGTPNDGMYRPGCPGYGRREVSDVLLKVRDSASASKSLQDILPLIEELIQRLPEMMGGNVSASSGKNNGTASATASVAGDASVPAATATAAVQQQKNHNKASTAAKQSNSKRAVHEDELAKRQSDNSLADAITSLVESLLEGLLGSTDVGNATSTAGNATATADSAATRKSSSTSSSSSSLLMSLLSSLNKRDGIDLNLLNGLLGNLLSGDNASQSSDSTVSKRSGININALNNLLGNLLGGDNAAQSSNSAVASKRGGIDLNLLNGLLGNLLSGDNAKQSSDSSVASKRGGIDLNLLNGLLGNLLSGDNASQSSNSAVSKRSGININALNNLLGNLLSGDNASQSSNSVAKARRAFIELTARADFKPVWDEAKKLGNNYFALERRGASSGLAPVWSSFRDMVDAGYKHGLDRRSPLPSPSPAVDTSAFTHAAASYVKQHFFHPHDRRAMDQFQPLVHAAGKFAKSQMQEWTDALNEHSAKHGKIHA